MQKKLISITLSAALGLGLCAPAYAATTTTTQPTAVVTAALKDGVLQLDELNSCVKHGNENVLAITESLTNLNNVDRETVVKSLKAAKNGLSYAIWEYSQYNSDTSALKSQQSAIEDQLDAYSEENYAKTYNNSLLQINTSINQIVKSSESLYFGIVSMDYSAQSIQRSLDALNRSLATMKVRCQLGQASQEDLRALQDQYTDVKSQLTALQAQSKTSKQSLQSLLGVTQDGSLQLAAPAVVSDATISAISLSADITAGKAASAALSTDQLAVDDAKDDLDDYHNSPAKQHAYQQAVYTLSAAQTSFETNASVLYQTLLEKQRLYKVAASDLTAAQKTYSVSQKKYALGILSKQDLLTAQDTLSAAQQAVEEAALDLNSAYAAYNWVRLGIAGS